MNSPLGAPAFTESVYAVCASMITGVTVDLLLFVDRDDAKAYAAALPMPAGFERVDVVERQIVGSFARRQAA